MRLIHALPLLAGLALAACNNSDDELADEALSMEDVLAEIEDNGIMPQPGQYIADVELISFEMPGATTIDMSVLQQEFAEGAASNSTYCVTEEMNREAWISEMTDNSCTVSRLTADGSEIDLAMSCTAPDGPQGRILMTGTTTETGSDMEMAFNQPIPGIGDASIRLRVSAQRTGDCQ